VQFAAVTGFDSSAHLGDFLRLAGAALVLLFLMVAVVRLLPIEAGSREPSSSGLSAEGDGGSTGGRSQLLSRGLSGLGVIAAVAGGFLYFGSGTRTAGSALVVLGSVLHATGRQLKPFSGRRKAGELASTAAPILLWLLPTWATLPLLVAAMVVYLVSSKL